MLSKEMYEYDNGQNTWIKKANMLFAKANFSLCVLNQRIYSFGGVSTGQIPLDIVEYYDIGDNKWIYVGSMPTPFVAGCVVMHEDKFYILGGRNGVGELDTLTQ
jgi:N-acetylneuraminic acid mutarotase